MAASLFLLLAVILAFTAGTGPWIIVATVVLATAAGTRLPDLDAPLRLGHRSALLHSGTIATDRVLSDDPMRGRLTVTAFLMVA